LCLLTDLYNNILIQHNGMDHIKRFAINCTFTHFIYSLMYFLHNKVDISYLTVFSFCLHLCSFIIGLKKTYIRGRN